MDVTGFTAITESLLLFGQEGAEVLNKMLNTIFEPVITAIYDRGGFISGFAGDGFTAIFADEQHPGSACYSALVIKQVIQEIGQQSTRFGEFQITVKIGLSYGLLFWGIVGDEKSKTYYFRGPAIIGCIESLNRCHPMDIIIDHNLRSRLLEPTVEKVRQHYFKLISLDEAPVTALASCQQNLSDTVLSAFLPDSVIEYASPGEFRVIVCIFLSFVEFQSFPELNNFVGDVIKRVHSFGGYLESLDFGDKGNTCLILFGVPISYEKNIQRALKFIYAFQRDYGKSIRAGVTYGTVFAGIKGSHRRSIFGVLGDIVNVAARIMSVADWGSIWLDQNISKKIEAEYEVIEIGSRKLKGKSKPVRIFKLFSKKILKPKHFSSSPLIGREYELYTLSRALEDLTEKKSVDVFYVYGDPGIGKSRLIHDSIQKYLGIIQAILLQSDSILRKSFNSFISMLHHFFHQSEADSDEEKKMLFEKYFQEFLSRLGITEEEIKKRLIKELLRTKSILGALLGLFWPDSLYERLSAQVRYENTLYALRDFMKALCLLKPTVFILEDLHWMDRDSHKVFEVLTRSITDFPMMILVSSRYHDDNTLPTLQADPVVEVRKLVLQTLPNQGLSKLVKNQLQHNGDKKLIEIISLKTGGNPFFIEQFCLFLLENSLLTLQDDHYSLKSSITEIPTGIKALLIARFDRLDLKLKETVHLASVLGRELNSIVLFELVRGLNCAASNLTPGLKNKEKIFHSLLNCEELPHYLKEGVTAQIWDEISEKNYMFKHSLLQETAYDMQLKERLRQLHRLVAKGIENLFPNEKALYSDLAFHYAMGEVRQKTIEFLEKAGQHAKEKFE
ncbi:AAA family ATPase, partial [candidate division CSSED10-310 bacterium]